MEYLRGIEAVNLAILFRESDPGKTKLSFRSIGEIDCSLLAGRFGGGGHFHAAGANLDVSLEEAVEIVLPQARSVVGEAKK